MRLLVALCLCASMVAPVRADRPEQRFLDHLPLLGQPTSAAKSGALAWSVKRRGAQELWVADGDSKAARLRYAYPNDDGIPLSEVTLSPDGGWLIYLRGSNPNRQGEINNPNDLPDPQERALWALSLAAGEPIRIAGGATPALRSPVVSPDSRTVAYARGKEVWFASLSSPVTPQRAFTIRGNAAELAWSPDGRFIAFVSQRATHSFVGVFEIATRELRYLAPGLDRDSKPVWSPDGRKLAFTRRGEEVQSYRFTPRRTGIPWSIMMADAKAWSTRVLWRADPGAGSVLAPMYDGRTLLWLNNDALSFAWEKTSWRQLYRIDVASGAVKQLTATEGEVSAATVTEDGKALVFQGNSQNRERFDLWRLDLSAGRVARISMGVSSDFAPVPSSTGVAFVSEGLDEPRALYLIGSGPSSRKLTPEPEAQWPRSSIVAPEVVELQASDGVVSHGLLYLPRASSKGQRHPALLYVHGGPTDISALGITKYDAKYAQSAVQHGYAVLMLNYRGGIGYGLDFREAAGTGGGGATDLLDVAAAGEYLSRRPDVDTKRLGIVGQSYGGYLVTAALARMPDVWAGGVSIVGVADWQMELELDSGAPLPFRSSERMRFEDRAHASSANAHLERWRAPILFISADDDQDGWLDQAIQLGQSLRRQGVTVEALVEPGGVHGAATHAQLSTRMRTMLDFFDRHLIPEVSR